MDFYNFDSMKNSELGLAFSNDPVLYQMAPVAIQNLLDRVYAEADPDSFCYVGSHIRGWLSGK